MINVLVTSPCNESARSAFQSKFGGRCSFIFRSPDNISDVIVSADAIIGVLPLEDIQKAENLRWVQMTQAGTDRYTCHDGFPADVILTNASGAFGVTISEYVMGAVLSLYRRFPVYSDNMKHSLWQDAGAERTLFGETVLILGTGDIGSNIAKRMKPFGVKIIGVKRTKSAPSEYFDEFHTIDELDALLPCADIVIGCVPNTPLTDGLLNEKRLRLMKQNSLLVNVGRGTLIDEAALIKVMSEGHLYGAVLDVFEEEPLPADSPLWKLPNVMITPHISGKGFSHSPATERMIWDIAAENLSRFLNGEPLIHTVDIKKGY